MKPEYTTLLTCRQMNFDETLTAAAEWEATVPTQLQAAGLLQAEGKRRRGVRGLVEFYELWQKLLSENMIHAFPKTAH